MRIKSTNQEMLLQKDSLVSLLCRKKIIKSKMLTSNQAVQHIIKIALTNSFMKKSLKKWTRYRKKLILINFLCQRKFSRNN